MIGGRENPKRQIGPSSVPPGPRRQRTPLYSSAASSNHGSVRLISFAPSPRLSFQMLCSFLPVKAHYAHNSSLRLMRSESARASELSVSSINQRSLQFTPPPT